MHDVQQLMRRAKAGDRQSIGQLLEMYRNYLRVLARLQMAAPLQAKLSPSDLVQDTFLKAQQRMTEFRGSTECELLAWLRRILANSLADAVRSFKTQGRDLDLEESLEARLDESSFSLRKLVPADDPTPSEQAVRREQEVRLADALEMLPPQYREVIFLRHVRGLKFPEVARTMARSQDSVKNLWVRAIASLRTLVQEADG